MYLKFGNLTGRTKQLQWWRLNKVNTLFSVFTNIFSGIIVSIQIQIHNTHKISYKTYGIFVMVMRYHVGRYFSSLFISNQVQIMLWDHLMWTHGYIGLKVFTVPPSKQNDLTKVSLVDVNGNPRMEIYTPMSTLNSV